MNFGGYTRIRLLLVAVIAITIAGPVSCSRPAISSSSSNFQQFWADFRMAALQNDVDRVIALTRFPFKTKGTLDSDPPKSYDMSAFRQLLPKLLAEDVGLSSEPVSMKRYIEQKTTVPEQGLKIRVGQFVFEKSQGKWAFAMAYVEDE
jgi:hypothetical protein